jgi:hypothetical protein
MAKRLISTITTAIILVLLLSARVALAQGTPQTVDPRLVGTWEGVVPSPEGGQLHLRFKPRADGTFETSFPGTPLPPVDGLFIANNGTWSMRTLTLNNSGTYLFTTPDQVTFKGLIGPPVTYERVGH